MLVGGQAPGRPSFPICWKSGGLSPERGYPHLLGGGGVIILFVLWAEWMSQVIFIPMPQSKDSVRQKMAKPGGVCVCVCFCPEQD